MFIFYYIYVWIIWLIKTFFALWYDISRAPDDYNPSTSVVIPVVDEDEDIFREVLSSVTSNKPSEIIVVINGPRNISIESLCDEYKVNYQWTRVAGKRNALALGIEKANSELIILVDSDTIWTDNTMGELIKPFYDPTIGGVSTLQKIVDPNKNLINRMADWLEGIRAHGTMSAMSAFGTVGCLPGRTIAFRRSILLNSLYEFQNERFLGVKAEISDDRAMTNFTLKAGYKTVLQKSSVVYTHAPETWGKFVRQQLRWAQGSRFYTLKMLPWMLTNAPITAIFYINDFISPFLLLAVILNFLINIITDNRTLHILADTQLTDPALLWSIIIVSVFVSIGLRQIIHFIHKKQDILYLPHFVAIINLLLTPIALYAVWIVARDQKWGTRANAVDNSKSKKQLQLVPQVALSIFVFVLVVSGQALELTTNPFRIDAVTQGQVAGVQAVVDPANSQEKAIISNQQTQQEVSTNSNEGNDTLEPNKENTNQYYYRVIRGDSLTTLAQRVLYEYQWNSGVEINENELLKAQSILAISYGDRELEIGEEILFKTKDIEDSLQLVR